MCVGRYLDTGAIYFPKQGVGRNQHSETCVGRYLDTGVPHPPALHTPTQKKKHAHATLNNAWWGVGRWDWGEG